MFERIANFQALCEAAQRAAKGKRRKPGVAGFLANLERNVLRLERELLDGTWRPGSYTVIEVRDPNKPQNLRSANRNRNTPDNRNNNLGFRVASTLCWAGTGAAKAAPGAPMSVQSPSW